LVDPHQKGALPEQVLGLHVPGRFDKVLDIDECHLQHPLGNRVLALVKQLAARYELEPWDVHTHKGFLRHLVVRVAGAASEPQLMVNLVTSREDVKRLKPLVDELVGQVPEVSSLINNINTRKATVAYGEWEVKLHGSPFITAQLRGLRFDISANSFFQTNTAQAGVLYEQIEKAANLDGSEMLFDLYCGTGTIAIDLARQAREVAGFEMVDSAVDDAARNALANEVFNVRFFHADLGDRYFANHGKRLFKQVDKPDVIVSDPPRAGMHPKLVKEVMDLAAKKIVYVSCNPATQARDVALLVEGGYQVKYLQPVDMFPHTPHIENLCVLDRK
ncbi:MAG: 23S rRNA (uracil(1939)-C(5))-methyltransferase RlmD, partial [Candidatus Marinimicrobia bacterium]|nr:23S rRNA (uracil(1939)-C(5))-methyltransferase RlmD [Candidatus Neomarinimicrobiota bacterium]